MVKRILALLFLGCFMFTGTAILSSAVLAQGRGDAPTVKYKKKTVYDFDDDLVEGELQRPDGEFIDTQRRAKHSSLITIRADFIPEMLKSAEDI